MSERPYICAHPQCYKTVFAEVLPDRWQQFSFRTAVRGVVHACPKHKRSLHKFHKPPWDREPIREIERKHNPSATGCLACGGPGYLHPGAPPLCSDCFCSLDPEEKIWYWRNQNWSHAVYVVAERAQEARDESVVDG